MLFWESYAEVFVGGFLGVNRALLPEKVSVAGSIFSITVKFQRPFRKQVDNEALRSCPGTSFEV